MTESLFATPSSGIARVALPVPIDRLFDYRVPEAMDASALAGHRVQVTFGGRPLVGLICERMQEDAPGAPQHTAELSDLDGVIDTQSVVSPALIQILRETAAELLTPVGIALCAALPRGWLRESFATLPSHRAARQHCNPVRPTVRRRTF